MICPGGPAMKKLGFPREDRLLKSIQFKSVYQQARVHKEGALWLYVKENNLSHNRLGISVSNKSCINLVQRNRIKRILREIFRLNRSLFGQGVDVVVVLKKRPSQIDYSSFLKIITDCLSKPAQIIKNHSLQG